MEIFTYPFDQQWAALLARLKDAEQRVQQPGEPEPTAPYLRLEPGGWREVSGELRPAVEVQIVHPATDNWAIVEAAKTEQIVYALMRHGMIALGAQAAALIDLPIGTKTYERFVSRSLWRFP